MFGLFSRQSDVHRQYTSRKSGGRGLKNIELSAKSKCNAMFVRMNGKSESWMENAIKERNVERSNNLELENTLEKCKAKALHGQFIRDTESNVSPFTWNWLRLAGM